MNQPHPIAPANRPVMDRLLAEVRRLHAAGRPWATLLAICPNSEAVLRAAVLAAVQARAPLLLATTLNQVDLDRGYTGWTPEDLVRLCREFAQTYGVTRAGCSPASITAAPGSRTSTRSSNGRSTLRRMG